MVNENGAREGVTGAARSSPPDVLVLEDEELAATRAEADRLRHALEHIAAGNISPSIDFARAVLAGATVEEAHAAAAAAQDRGDEDEARWLTELAKECEACACFGVPCASCQQGDVCTGSCERHELGDEVDDQDGADLEELDDDCLQRRAEALDRVLERRRREADEAEHA